MKTKIGIWIDHRRAVIVLASSVGNVFTEILSKAEHQPGRVDGEKSVETFQTHSRIADEVKDQKLDQHLNEFYHEVIDCTHEAGHLLIFGPGEAKAELRKRLDREKPGNRVVWIETEDKMTNPQIAAKVRNHFEKIGRGMVV